MLEVIILVGIGIVFMIGFILGGVEFLHKFHKDVEDEIINHYKLPRCNCADPDKCSTWCQTRNSFKKESDGKI